MLFYLALFLLAFIIAGMAVWALQALRSAAQSSILASRPSPQSRALRQNVVKSHLRSPEGPLKPWGWGGRRRKSAKVQAFAKAATTGVMSKVRVGWPYRDEPYVSEKDIVSSSRTLGESRPGSKLVGVRKVEKGGTSRPWGW